MNPMKHIASTAVLLMIASSMARAASAGSEFYVSPAGEDSIPAP